jgi:hypothetical protein
MRTKLKLSILASLVLLALIIVPLQCAWAAAPPTIWDKTFGGAGDDAAYSGQQTDDNCYILAGMTNSFGAGGSDAWLIKTEADGAKTWDQTFGGTAFDAAASVQQTADVGYVLGGLVVPSGAENDDAWLAKVASEARPPP